MEAEVKRRKQQTERAALELKLKKEELDAAVLLSKQRGDAADSALKTMQEAAAKEKKELLVEKTKQPEDFKEKDAEKAKVNAFVAQLDKIISEGAVQQKKSMYEEAVAIFQKAADLAASKKPEYHFFKKNVIEREAMIFSNIAACHKQT